MVRADFVNRVFEGDCLGLMSQLPAPSVDMILCDLPYYGLTQNKWDIPLDLEALWGKYKLTIKEDGVIALTSHGHFTGKLIESEIVRLFGVWSDPCYWHRYVLPFCREIRFIRGRDNLSDWHQGNFLLLSSWS